MITKEEIESVGFADMGKTTKGKHIFVTPEINLILKDDIVIFEKVEIGKNNNTIIFKGSLNSIEELKKLVEDINMICNPIELEDLLKQ